ncbi:SAM-dependent methyltransferase [Larkinella soli]|uniref:SAM-dependent methyltransferase n=1 Tax=Larkinella soli TaxID=1770527 RepID=UPI000FFB78D7|nr:class I SAM-dependent methyltransferase [Larkinella soli]
MAWYENFFHGMIQEAWKTAQDEEETELECDFLLDVLNLEPGWRVLDVFCGYGRHALPLARSGCRVTGVDISEEYLEEFRTAARRERLAVETVSGDVLTVPLPGGFDAAFCFGNSFSFFPHDRMLAFLQKIAGQLKDGAWFVADTGMIAESVLPDFQERTWVSVGDITVLMENEYDARQSRIDSRLTYLRRDHTEHRLAQHYLYTVAGLCRLFQEAELEVTELFGNLDGTDFRLGDDRLLIVSRKNPAGF